MGSKTFMSQNRKRSAVFPNIQWQLTPVQRPCISMEDNGTREQDLRRHSKQPTYDWTGSEQRSHPKDVRHSALLQQVLP